MGAYCTAQQPYCSKLSLARWQRRSTDLWLNKYKHGSRFWAAFEDHGDKKLSDRGPFSCIFLRYFDCDLHKIYFAKQSIKERLSRCVEILQCWGHSMSRKRWRWWLVCQGQKAPSHSFVVMLDFYLKYLTRSHEFVHWFKTSLIQHPSLEDIFWPRPIWCRVGFYLSAIY